MNERTKKKHDHRAQSWSVNGPGIKSIQASGSHHTGSSSAGTPQAPAWSEDNDERQEYTLPLGSHTRTESPCIANRYSQTPSFHDCTNKQ